MSGTVLVVGGAGYVGSHVCKALSLAGYTPVVYDSFITGHPTLVRFGPYVEADVLDAEQLQQTLRTYSPFAVIHLAALSNIRQSYLKEKEYYRCNVEGTQVLLQALVGSSVSYFVFSSSASVYGMGSYTPLSEKSPLQSLHPYAKTKILAEELVARFCSKEGLSYANLRYFNVAGADVSAEIGESHDPETHLIPLLIQIIKKEKEIFPLLGRSHSTIDGSAQRDFIHVTDLAAAHIDVLHWMQKYRQNITLNIGSGKGHTILEVIDRLQKKTGSSIPISLHSPTEEPGSLIADISKAQIALGWTPKHSDLDTIIDTALRWHLS